MSQTPSSPAAPDATRWPANWYPDPQQEAPYRYWNGERWTQRTRDTMPLNPVSMAALASCVAVAAGSIGPWISSGLDNVSGTSNGSDGLYTLFGGIAAAIAVVAYLVKQDHGWLLVAAVIGAGIVYVGVADIQDIDSRHTVVFGTDISPSTGWGIWLMLLGGAALALSSFWIYRSHGARPAQRPPVGRPR